MPAIVPADEIEQFQKYADENGRIQLSAGFFQKMFSRGGNETGYQILQIYQLKSNNQENFCGRARCSDGMFFTSCVYFDASLKEQLENDHMFDSTCSPLIAAKSYHFSKDTSLGGGLKTPIVITEYELIVKDSPRNESATNLPATVEAVKGYTGYHGNPAYVSLKLPNADQNDSFEESEPPRKPTAAPQIRHPPARQDSGGSATVTPIAAITPYINKWRILGKVTNKQDMRTITSAARGQMKVLNFDLTDDRGTTIRCASFSEVAEKVNQNIQLRNSYYLTNCTVRPANKQFNATGHDYELTIRNADDLVLCLDHEIPEPKLTLRPVLLDKLAQHTNQLVDVLALIDAVAPLNEFTAKSGNEVVKRDVSLIDDTGTMVTLTLWGDQAREFETNPGQVIGIHGARVKEFNGALSISAGQTMQWNPEMSRVHTLLDWWANARNYCQPTSISAGVSRGPRLERDLTLLGTATALNYGKDSEKGQYFSVVGFFRDIKQDNALYQACPNEGCQKKVIAEHNQYRCEKCNKVMDTFKWNMIVHAEIYDSTNLVWVSMFSKTGEQILGTTAQELGDLRENNQAEYEAVFQRILHVPYQFRLRAKAEFYNEEERMKYSVVSAEPVDWDTLKGCWERTLKQLKTVADAKEEMME
ncbi:unnamed protein product, partial [Mesorhabditis spiculigera]